MYFNPDNEEVSQRPPNTVYATPDFHTEESEAESQPPAQSMYSSSSQKHVQRSVFVKEYLVPTRVSDANGQEWRSEGVKTTEFT